MTWDRWSPARELACNSGPLVSVNLVQLDNARPFSLEKWCLLEAGRKVVLEAQAAALVRAVESIHLLQAQESSA